MEEIEHPPEASSLLQSMRSIGYSLESALADLIDNSISAKAAAISIEFRPDVDPYVAIIDDGIGMSPATLATAMRHGSTNPLLHRSADDLGRYGLGLKTSSLSQCRTLTVASLHGGTLSAYCWDLDIVEQRRAWILLKLDDDDIARLPHVDRILAVGHGTIVLWRNLDRLTAGEHSIDSALQEKMAVVHAHLALVFHRFLKPEPPFGRTDIFINGASLDTIDPFMTKHPATQRLDEESFTVEGSRVIVRPYVLPHYSKLTPNELRNAGGGESIRNQQGFYIYRARRLIIWGTWFRLGVKDELGKLARVQVDVPNSLDHLWTLDIKKAAAYPPEVVRTNLKRIIDQIRGSSARTITFRGRVKNRAAISPAWNEVIDRDFVRFEINRDHPAIIAFAATISDENKADFHSVLSVMESSFPADLLYSRMASDVKPNFSSNEDSESLRAIFHVLISGFPAGSSTLKSALLKSLHLIEPFNFHPLETIKILEEFNSNAREEAKQHVGKC
ncbi:ATP-binding protein [Alcaligenaceae bacterium B3P038]|nr:ATP-binding protein [Alcaligenaceae bacterium B3P038]